MLPFMAQGAAQAIDDGVTLAGCLAQPGWDVPEALRHYERLRILRTVSSAQNPPGCGWPATRRSGAALAHQHLVDGQRGEVT